MPVKSSSKEAGNRQSDNCNINNILNERVINFKYVKKQT